MKTEELEKLSFGPVPSRRLGRSLGINNIPAKVCSYGCVYCQLGRTLHNQIERTPFYAIDDLVASAKIRIEAAKEKNETIDYLAFVPDGEPTLDIHLGDEIEALHKFGIKIAVISNASLIWREDVRKDLCKADWVSLKVDAVTEHLWHKVNRANKSLKLDDIQKGMIDFKSEFRGFYATETMLVDGINDSKEELTKIAAFLQKIQPTKSYISIPTRPPAEEWVKAPGEEVLTMAYQIFTDHGIDTELIIGYEGDDFAFTGDAKSDLLSITSVHPMRKEAVEAFLKKANSSWSVVTDLIDEGKLLELEYDNHLYYARKLSRKR
ncbi:radical SAM protein [Sulfurovum sp.]|uniref:radical SAM protein n=1 Tax=Sulfurovum sp. TaxID=1969726 RepID=UPI0025E8E58F|nr:radical SAM protein [Sulfurovum sp.]